MTYPVDPQFICSQLRQFFTFRFPEVGPGDSRVLTFDFSLDLAAGETLNGAPTVVVTCSAGGDPSPTNVLNGAAAYNAPTNPPVTQVQQPINAGNALLGCDYYFRVSAPTSNPQKVLTREAILPVRG
jgi:hypothetical protein